MFGDAGFKIAEKNDVDGYKIHSEDLLNTFFIEKVARTNKILLIGVGGAHRIEIHELLNYLNKQNLSDNIVLMPGVQTFPTSIASHSIEEISDLNIKYKQYGVKVGFADHISGDLEEALTIPLMAFTNGAAIVEKHITVNRADKWEDYESALDKDKFGLLVRQINNLVPLLMQVGSVNKAERDYREAFKKTAVMVKDVKANSLIKPDDILFSKRKDRKYPLSALQIIGKKANINLQADDPVRLGLLKNNVGGIIVARCSSSRLPSKAVMKIEEKETISLLIERIKRCKNLDVVILATSTDKTDDILEKIAHREGIQVFRGSLNNLSQRFYDAARYYELDHIVRITGDDILRDEVAIDLAITSHLEASCNVTIMENMPYGTASEIFTISTLKIILDTVQEPDNTEYLEYYLENSRYFSVNTWTSNYVFNDIMRLTLDYSEDFDLFKKVFEKLYRKNNKFVLQDAIELFDEEPTLLDINQHKTLKYLKSDLNLELNI